MEFLTLESDAPEAVGTRHALDAQQQVAAVFAAATVAKVARVATLHAPHRVCARHALDALFAVGAVLTIAARGTKSTPTAALAADAVKVAAGPVLGAHLTRGRLRRRERRQAGHEFVEIHLSGACHGFDLASKGLVGVGCHAVFLRRLALVPFALALAACQPKIGDPCVRAVDCSIRGERQCDLSNAPFDPSGEGECTIENCAYGTCPSEGTCVAAYGSAFLTVACDPAREDTWSEAQDGSALPPLDLCAADELCLPEGLCGYILSVRTSCRLKCKKDSDCRGGYECRATGSGGVYVSPNPDNPSKLLSGKICMPDPAS